MGLGSLSKLQGSHTGNQVKIQRPSNPRDSPESNTFDEKLCSGNVPRLSSENNDRYGAHKSRVGQAPET